MTIGRRLKQLRQNSGLTLDELAVKINSTKATLCRYENDKRVPNVDFLEIISKFYECTSDYILGVDRINNHIDVAYIEVIQSAKNKNISPSKLKKLIDFLESD